MILKLKASIRILILLMSFGPCTLHAQGFNNLIATFKNYREQAYEEKVYIHTDRTFYLAGDYIWLKAYLVNGVNHQPDSLSKIVYVEVLDQDNVPVIQAKIGIEKESMPVTRSRLNPGKCGPAARRQRTGKTG